MGLVLPGDFNANLRKYGNDSNVSEFLDAMHSNSFLPKIASPTCGTTKSKTLIDKIFANNYNPSFLSGITVTIFYDHNARFFLIEFETRQDENKNNKLYRDFVEIERNRDFINDQLKSVNWEVKPCINSNSIDLSLELPLNKVQKSNDFWAAPHKMSNKRKISKGNLGSPKAYSNP